MPSSRKRAKGKLRKAKSISRSVCVDNSAWRNWALYGERMPGIQCSHGSAISSLDDGYNDISKFLDDLVDSMSSIESIKQGFDFTNVRENR